MKKILLLLLIPLFLSCSSDDYDSEYWQAEAKKREQWLIGQWSDKHIDPDAYYILVFKEDGTFYELFYDSPDKIMIDFKATYSVKHTNDNVFTIIVTYDNGRIQDYSIFSLDSSTQEFLYSEKAGEFMYRDYEEYEY